MASPIVTSDAGLALPAPVVDFPADTFPFPPVALLQAAFERLELAVHDFHFVVGDLLLALKHFAAQLLPLTLEHVFVHGASFTLSWTLQGRCPGCCTVIRPSA